MSCPPLLCVARLAALLYNVIHAILYQISIPAIPVNLVFIFFILPNEVQTLMNYFILRNRVLTTNRLVV